MKKIITAVVLLTGLTAYCQNTRIDSSAALANLKSSAQKMRQYLVDRNFTEFVKFIPPEISKMAGGQEQLAALTKKSIKDMEAQGMAITDVSVDFPGKLISYKNQLQFVVQENLNIKVKGGHLQARSYLLALSYDKGKTWYFVDTSGKTLAQMQAGIPNLSSQLVIPAKEQPLFFKD